jgi:hypothetical protein
MTTQGIAISPIQAVAAEAPEMALLGACLKLAVDDARGGDPEARPWLASDACLAMLSWLLP